MRLPDSLLIFEPYPRVVKNSAIRWSRCAYVPAVDTKSGFPPISITPSRRYPGGDKWTIKASTCNTIYYTVMVLARRGKIKNACHESYRCKRALNEARLLADTTGRWENKKIITPKTNERGEREEGARGSAEKSSSTARAEIGHTPAACKTRGEIKCFINVIKVKSCLSNEPRWIIQQLCAIPWPNAAPKAIHVFYLILLKLCSLRISGFLWS